MDHSHYGYSALPKRPQEPTGTSARLQAFVVLCLEHWVALPPVDSLRDPRFVGEFGSFTPDYRSWTQREYGLRIGIFRVLDALKARGIRPAIAANSVAVQRLPQLVETLNEWGCEWIGHAESASVLMHSGYRPEHQAEIIEQSLNTIVSCTGHKPLGWLSQDWGTTVETYKLLAQAGIRYTLDWTNDDQPYMLNTQPGITAIPLGAEWDDVQSQWLRNLDPRSHARLALSAFDRLRLEAIEQQRQLVFGLTLHPWVCGMSSRIGSLRQLLADMHTRPDVNWTQPADIFHNFQQNA
jgi:peptidoglycan/xylan/chitin deacetylase (PgdA/CDA1 family)